MPRSAAPLPAYPRLFDSAGGVAALYLAIVVVTTWPLVLGLRTDLPTNLGDPVFVAWAIARASTKLTALFGGDLSAASTFWDGRIFFPHALTGAYSEHFLGQALLTLPVWWLTHNVLLCYNLLFLGSAVMCGVGMYLLVRDLTGHGAAAFVAGLCFACAPYRIASAAQLQVQSAQWMPLALLALRRYVRSGGKAALAGGVGAIVMQNLSSGYFMIYFAPLAGLWTACWLTAERQWTNRRRVAALAGAGLAAFVMTLPFALPYLTVLELFGSSGRPLQEAAVFSADVAAWATASADLTVWGWLALLRKGEGELFLGVALPVLATLGVASASVSRAHTTTKVFAVVIVLLAAWMALGPFPSLMGRRLPIPSLFALAHSYVPGFNVARVPTRFQMILLVGGALLSGFGALAIARRPTLLGIVAGVAILDGAAVPMPRNVLLSPHLVGGRPLTNRLTPTRPPPVYGYLATLPPSAAIAHFPLGLLDHDVRYMFYSATLPSAIVNGYSGAVPPDWGERVRLLSYPMRAIDSAWSHLTSLKTTHAVVHGDAWDDATGADLGAAFERRGARPVYRDGSTVVYELPRP